MKKRLSKEQRTLSLRTLQAQKHHKRLADAKNYQKQWQKIARLQNKIRHQRDAFLDQISIDLIRKYDLTIAEDLKSQNLMKNHSLASAISDVEWRTFIQKMTYKAELYERTFILVNPKKHHSTMPLHLWVR